MTDIPDAAARLAAQAIAETFNTFAGALATGGDAGSVADDWLQESRAALVAAAPALLVAERQRCAEIARRAIGAIAFGAGSEHYRHGRATMADDAMLTVTRVLGGES